MDSKLVIILRGLPGAGKSTLSKLLVSDPDYICEADAFQVDADGNYDFKVERLGYAHGACYDKFTTLVDIETSTIVVSNTSTTVNEFSKYKTYAEENGYRVTVVVVENRHGNESIHDVPEETMEKMRERFQIQL